MAMFQQYQNGVTPVTGMAEAGANIGRMYMQGIGQMGESLAKGLQAYNENSAKSEMANVKIQSLSQDIANKIAMYSQDPEIAQSGVLQGLMQKGQMLTEAPTKGLSQRLAIAHDAETSLAGFGQQLQEWSFLRGRAIERGIADALNRFKNATTVTESVFYDGKDPELLVDPNQTIPQQKDRVMARFKQIRAANPQIQGTDEDFWAGWVSDAQQRFAKGIEGANPSVTSAQLEALQAEQNILKSQSAVDKLDAGAIDGLIMNKDGLYEEQKPVSVSVKDYEATMKSASDKVYENTQEGMDLLFGYGKASPEKTNEISERLKTYKKDISDLDEDISKVQSRIQKGDEASLGTASRIANNLKRWGVGVTDWWSHINAKNVASYSDKEITPEDADRIITETATSWTGLGKAGLATVGSNLRVVPSVIPQLEGLKQVLLTKFPEISGRDLTTKEIKVINDAIARFDATRKEAIETLSKDSPALLEALKSRKALLASQIQKTEKEATAGEFQKTPAPKVALGDLVVGQVETTRPLTVSERKSQVSDFLTERFGAIDPTDPTGKRRIAVQGFDSFFQKAVPESEIKEFTTENGTKLIHINGKWEMMKSAEPRSMADMRKDMIGIYGQQTKDGRLVPTELIPNSGIEIGGVFRGSDASEAQYNDEITQLSDARRSIKKLQEINDSVGEFADLTKAGIAEVEVMNLKSALRKDIIGVGTVSNFEQSLIDKVIRNPTDFFSMESKDRAILLALAQRIDRRIQNISAAKGLTVRIRDVNSANRYEALRQQYLKAKGIL